MTVDEPSRVGPSYRRAGASYWRAGVVLAVLAACLQAPPDVGGTVPVREEDTRIVVLLREADAVAERDGPEAARMIRGLILPRASANALAAAALRPRHPLAQRLADRLAVLTSEREDVLRLYASSLDQGDVSAELTAVRRQRRLEEDMLRLDARIDTALHTPASRGCTRPSGD